MLNVGEDPFKFWLRVDEGHQTVGVRFEAQDGRGILSLRQREDPSPVSHYEELDIDLEPAVETYTYVNTDGETETRTEEPFITWYTDWLQVEQEVTLYPDTPCAFTAPRSAPDVEGRIWAVIRDRRGGISWEIRRWRLVEE